MTYLVGNQNGVTYEGVGYAYNQAIELQPSQVQQHLDAGFILKSADVIEIPEDLDTDIWAIPS